MSAVIIDNTNRLLQIAEDLAAAADSGWIELPQKSGIFGVIAWIPGAGGTMDIELTLDSVVAVRADTAVPITIAAATADNGYLALPALVTAVRFTATTQDGKYRVVV